MKINKIDFPCGCTVNVRGPNLADRILCPTHKTAPELLETLKLMILASGVVKLWRTVETMTALDTASKQAQDVIDKATQ